MVQRTHTQTHSGQKTQEAPRDTPTEGCEACLRLKVQAVCSAIIISVGFFFLQNRQDTQVARYSFVAERVIVHPSAELSRSHVCHYHLLILFFKQCVPQSNLCVCLPPAPRSFTPGCRALGHENCQSIARGGRKNESSFSLRFSKKPLSLSSPNSKKKTLIYLAFIFIS